MFISTCFVFSLRISTPNAYLNTQVEITIVIEGRRCYLNYLISIFVEIIEMVICECSNGFAHKKHINGNSGKLDNWSLGILPSIVPSGSIGRFPKKSLCVNGLFVFFSP